MINKQLNTKRGIDMTSQLQAIPAKIVNDKVVFDDNSSITLVEFLYTQDSFMPSFKTTKSDDQKINEHAAKFEITNEDVVKYAKNLRQELIKKAYK